MEMRQKRIAGPILIVLIFLAWTVNIGLRKKNWAVTVSYTLVFEVRSLVATFAINRKVVLKLCFQNMISLKS